jgi:hypothetical protein
MSDDEYQAMMQQQQEAALQQQVASPLVQGAMNNQGAGNTSTPPQQ